VVCLAAVQSAWDDKVRFAGKGRGVAPHSDSKNRAGRLSKSLRKFGRSFDGFSASRVVLLSADALKSNLGPPFERDHLVANLGSTVRVPRRHRLLNGGVSSRSWVRFVEGFQELDDRFRDPPPRAEQALEPTEVTSVLRKRKHEVRVRLGCVTRYSLRADDGVVHCREGQERDGDLVEEAGGGCRAVVLDGGFVVAERGRHERVKLKQGRVGVVEHRVPVEFRVLLQLVLVTPQQSSILAE
jgi:hypothetical protein